MLHFRVNFAIQPRSPSPKHFTASLPSPNQFWLTPFLSQRSVLPLPQLLSFDNHLDCLCLESLFRPLLATLLLFLSLFCRARQLISFFFNALCTLYKNSRGVPQLFFTPKAFCEGPICDPPCFFHPICRIESCPRKLFQLD